MDEHNFLFDRNARSIDNSNVPQNIVNHQDIYLNDFTKTKHNISQEVQYKPDTLDAQSETLKQEDEIEIKEEKLFDFKESDEHVDMAADSMLSESIGRIQQTQITSNVSDIPIIKTENVENICHSVKSPSQLDIRESIQGNNDGILKTCLKTRKLNMQLSDNNKEQFLFCDKCDYQTKNKLQLSRHCLLHDSNAALLNYSKYTYSTTRKRNFQAHMRNQGSEHKTRLSFKCEHCPYETREEVNIEVHLTAHQTNEKILKCSECYFITTCSNFLKNHMETHETKPKRLMCQKRDYAMTRHTNLVNHMSIHQENSSFPCDKCSYRAKTKSNLVTHMLVHQENYKFQCHKCNYQTKRKSDLDRHMLVHQENCYFSCDKCSYRAKIKSNLVDHMLVHQENYNFRCRKCSYQAKRKASLVSHMLIHQENYNFPCDTCSYRAKRKSHLVSHMLVHQENYNFRCRKCSYQAKRKSNLVEHMLIHQDNYNFQCYNCSYRSKTKSNLVYHMLRHQTEKR